ncbi:hypothetical protein F3J16_09825 [Burkholderia sp. Ap-962]|uniref:hypothetical protein n=1 Tax=Burkholderia sp. Ap-962 TaxID=2608333 RepID=UPI000B221579|nr:hypothetical protein [Burkholderia sp. Ap-962]NIF70481.1 hypothetical protein [Burkholderia sp. Ap-962]
MWLGMIAVLLLFGLLMWLRPEWFLSTIWVHPPHHLCDEAISHLYGERKSEPGVEAPADSNRPEMARTPVQAETTESD